MNRVKCLRCGYEWAPYKIETRLGWRQCPNSRCRSYSVVEAELFENIVEDVMATRNPQSEKLFPIIDTLSAILDQRGITLRPLQTLDLAAVVEREVIRRLQGGEK